MLARKILCVHSGGDVLRGSELVLLDLLRVLQDQGRDVRLLCDQVKLMKKARDMAIDADLLPRGEFMFDPPDSRFQVAGLAHSNWVARREIKRFRPHVLYCNGGRSMQMTVIAAKATGTPTAVHLHAPYTKRYLYLYGLNRADLVIHCSENVRGEHERKAKFKESVALLNAVDERRFPPITHLVRPASDVPILGFIGSLIHRKGVDILLHAVRILQSEGAACRLKVAGTDVDGAYPALARDLGVSAEFVGEVRRDNVAEFFASVHLHVLPSRMDAMPLSIIEAAYAGVPTIATTVGGIEEATMHGRLGVHYDDNTPEGLAKALRNVLTSEWMSPSKSMEIAALARRTFSLQNCGQKLGALLDRVVGVGAVPRPVRS